VTLRCVLTSPTFTSLLDQDQSVVSTLDRLTGLSISRVHTCCPSLSDKDPLLTQIIRHSHLILPSYIPKRCLDGGGSVKTLTHHLCGENSDIVPPFGIFVHLFTSLPDIMTTFTSFPYDGIFVCGCVLSWCLCICMCIHGGKPYFSIFRMKTLPTLSFWRTVKIWILLFDVVSLL
jgi:hypothetical protein